MWQPLRRVDNDPGFIPNPAMQAVYDANALSKPDEIWINDDFQVVVRHNKGNEGTLSHLSIHTQGRWPIHDWRRLQQIKNEVCGEERWAVEVYPPESELVDTSNEFHLWVMPEGHPLAIGFTGQRLVTSDEQVERWNRLREEGKHKGRQREWEPGLTTGRGRNGDSAPEMDRHMDQIEKGEA